MAELGHVPLTAPVLVVRRLEDVAIDLTGVSALAFTSTNGVRAFADLCPERGLKVFAVGAATGQAAKAVGFRQVLSSDGDVTALAESMATRWRELKGVVLHPGALEPAGDLVGALTAQGIEARGLTLYDTAPATFDDATLAELAQADIVLVHSPKAGGVIADLLKDTPTPNLKILALSKAVLEPMKGMQAAHKAFAPFPLEAALLNLIDRTPD